MLKIVADPDTTPDHMSPEEWQARCDLAACYRLTDMYGWSDLFGTHISLRVPGTDHFLLNPYGMLFEEITASSLIKVDEEGNVLDRSDYPINPAGFTIHSAVHMSAQHMNAVMHTHTRAGNAVACMRDGLLPNNQKALTMLPFVAYHDYESIAVNLEERERIVRDLGDSRVLVLRSHGLMSVGRTVGEAFLWMARMESACSYQMAILSTGQEIQPINEDIQQLVMEQSRAIFERDSFGSSRETEWQAMLRKLERAQGRDWMQ
ncbi:Decarboxylase NovR [Marinovum algicola]|uniref:Ribulose-5-phosphate 4-epimerase/Fuculose-1-phosphate aldolase n=1 Tax=Marinovum algicola TaxID=42444 RepID=A0A975WEW4_9RHOB|nr:class II aldolase/adducin family protein [Marinovum algicola]SEK09066.1 Ribulose-5-phosphate 4-epimerase/Fuculose-1-phosphate aldolase [Marinovum algicola]SLN71705.1 Decarboxylase NovR [Marinovum algicola]